jgi:hemerythrin
MQQHGYPEYTKHKAEHVTLTNQALQIQKDFKAGKSLPSNLLMFLKDWLMKHICGDDKKYGPYFNSKGVK